MSEPIPPPETNDLPQQPDIDVDTLENSRPTVATAEQAWQICRRLEQDNKERVLEAAQITEMDDGIVPPIPPSVLLEAGKSYKSNFSTGFMGALTGRVVGRLVMRVKSSQYLTGSALDTSVENSLSKSNTFKLAFTDMVRAWKGFPFFILELSLNVVRHGKVFVSFEGENNWRPRAFRIDEAAIPNGVRQGESPPYFWLQQVYPVEKLFGFIAADREAAETAGWDIENTVKAINSAKKRDGDEDKSTEEAALTYQDMISELIPSGDYMHSYNSIKVHKLYSAEPDGSISTWLINADNGDALFNTTYSDRTIDDIIQYVCFDIGNGTVHGAQGAGKRLYDQSQQVEITRNAAIDQLKNRGKFALYVQDATALNAAELRITDDAVYSVGAQFTGNQAAIPDNADAFLGLDAFLRGIAEERLGTYLPNRSQAEKTATQSQIDALKEEESNDSVTDLFLTYIGLVMAMVQRRAARLDSDDDAAGQFQAKCLAVMSIDEFNELANKPPPQTSLDLTDVRQARVAAFLQSRVGNPMYNQYAIERVLSDLSIGPELSSLVLIPENDNTQQVEAIRQQQDELFSQLREGVQVLVSPRDNHLVSMQVLSGDKDDASGNWSGALYGLLQEGNVKGAQAALQHYSDHFETAIAAGQLTDGQNIAKQFMGDAVKAIEIATQMSQQQQQAGAGGVAQPQV